MFLVGDMQMLHVYVQPAIICPTNCNEAHFIVYFIIMIIVIFYWSIIYIVNYQTNDFYCFFMFMWDI